MQRGSLVLHSLEAGTPVTLASIEDAARPPVRDTAILVGSSSSSIDGAGLFSLLPLDVLVEVISHIHPFTLQLSLAMMVLPDSGAGSPAIQTSKEHPMARPLVSLFAFMLFLCCAACGGEQRHAHDKCVPRIFIEKKVNTKTQQPFKKKQKKAVPGKSFFFLLGGGRGRVDLVRQKMSQ